LCDIKILAPGWLRTRLFAVFARSVLFGFILRLLFWPGYGNTTSEGVGLGRVWPWLRACGILAAVASGPWSNAAGLPVMFLVAELPGFWRSCFWRLASASGLFGGPGASWRAWIACFLPNYNFCTLSTNTAPFLLLSIDRADLGWKSSPHKKIMLAGLIFRWLAEAPLKKSPRARVAAVRESSR